MSEQWLPSASDQEDMQGPTVDELQQELQSQAMRIDALRTHLSATIAERDRLLKEVRKLDALEAMGVDNWEGYSDAMQYMNAQP